jgi:hypothetical protein
MGAYIKNGNYKLEKKPGDKITRWKQVPKEEIK